MTLVTLTFHTNIMQSGFLISEEPRFLSKPRHSLSEDRPGELGEGDGGWLWCSGGGGAGAEAFVRAGHGRCLRSVGVGCGSVDSLRWPNEQSYKPGRAVKHALGLLTTADQVESIFLSLRSFFPPTQRPNEIPPAVCWSSGLRWPRGRSRWRATLGGLHGP